MQMLKFVKLIIFFFSIISSLNGENYSVESAKERFERAWQEHKSVPIKNTLERHKALIAACFTDPGDCIVDVGAHIGNYVLYYSFLTGQKGKVIAYEANPFIFPILEQRLKRASLKNFVVKERAASFTTGEKILMKVYPKDLNAQCCTVEPDLMNEKRMPGNTTLVEVITERLDDFYSEKNPVIRFIKIDTEGHEHGVLKGAEFILLNHRPYVIFEYGYQPGVWEPDTIRQLEQLGYICFDLKNDHQVHPGHIEIGVTDLLGIPCENYNKVIAILPFLY